MKIALVSDDLVQSGGQERVFSAISDMFPDAPIYTSVASKSWKKYFKSRGRNLITSFAQRFPWITKLPRYYAPFFVHNIGLESFDFTEYDLVLSNSSRFAHHIITKPSTKHICYMHSPGRMLWETADYFKYETFGLLSPVRATANSFLKMPLSVLRMTDFTAAQRVDKFAVNSSSVQMRVLKYYKRDSQVIYPFVDIDRLAVTNVPAEDFYLIITRLVAWKRVDIAIEACKKLKKRLVVVGEGPDFPRLRAIANGSMTTFVGRVSDREKQNLLSRCLALIQTQREDFGLVPLEAMTFGKPVLAYGKGGVLETVLLGHTGSFFTEQSVESLAALLEKVDIHAFDPGVCRSRAAEFDRTVFISKIKQLVEGSS